MKKGFSLVELIVVIAIIALLFGIAIPSYLKVSENSRNKNYDAKIIDITNKAYRYGEDNINDVKANPAKYSNIPVAKLIEEGYIGSDAKDGNVIINPKTGDPMTEVITIIVDSDNKIQVTID